MFKIDLNAPMKEFLNRLGIRVIAEALTVWLVSAILAMMVLDEGYALCYYLIVSFLFWCGSFVYFLSRRTYRPSDLWAFRIGPFALLVLGLAGETVIDFFGK